MFAIDAGTWMPHVNTADTLTGSWFCPGVPATGEEGVGGEVIVSNRDSDELVGRFTVLTPDGAGAAQGFTVAPWSQSSIDVDALVTAPFASVVVELDGGGGIVEQRAIHPAGESVAPCSNDTSDTWYFADGFTVDGSVETLILTNPYDDVAIAQLSFATEAGESSPSAFRGFPIPPRSVKIIPIAELGARNEPVIAVEVTTTSGRIVLGRAQHYLGGGRLGYDVSLAAPALRDQFWFADGERGDGITETFSIFNPTDADVEVDAVFLGLPLEANFGEVPPIVVPSRRVVVFDPSAEETAAAHPRRPARGGVLDPVGAVDRGRAGDHAARRRFGRHVGRARRTATPGRFRRHPVASRHRSLGADAGCARRLQRGQRRGDDHHRGARARRSDPDRRLDRHPDRPRSGDHDRLESPDALDTELILKSTNRVFVERSLPRSSASGGGELAGRSGSWALPSVET